jgi:hypothetical protein
MEDEILHTLERRTCDDPQCPCWGVFLACLLQAEQPLFRHTLHFGNAQDAEAAYALLDEVFESGLAELEIQTDGGPREVRLIFATIAPLAEQSQAALRTVLAGIVAYDFNREEGAYPHDA